MSEHATRRFVAAVCASAALLLAGCGGGGGENTASAGELRTFTYEDTIDPDILDALQEASIPTSMCGRRRSRASTRRRPRSSRGSAPT